MEVKTGWKKETDDFLMSIDLPFSFAPLSWNKVLAARATAVLIAI